jgi:hypothetical protein
VAVENLKPSPTTVKTGLQKNAIGIPGIAMQGIATIALSFAILASFLFIVTYVGLPTPWAFFFGGILPGMQALNATQLAKVFPSAGGWHTRIADAFHPASADVTAAPRPWLCELPGNHGRQPEPPPNARLRVRRTLPRLPYNPMAGRRVVPICELRTTSLYLGPMRAYDDGQHRNQTFHLGQRGSGASPTWDAVGRQESRNNSSVLP